MFVVDVTGSLHLWLVILASILLIIYLCICIT